eukprot:TRINITY_DN1646_c0_g1_i2.p3 TRINITY_DN1646_c0_g1~~TRINITY_DN1646_c0_g1_i2.p3  ORF type:complete len:101 (+),score=0.43 TRINITY_DN1646_c0_g1_i2:181-483(+)
MGYALAQREKGVLLAMVGLLKDTTRDLTSGLSAAFPEGCCLMPVYGENAMREVVEVEVHSMMANSEMAEERKDVMDMKQNGLQMGYCDDRSIVAVEIVFD